MLKADYGMQEEQHCPKLRLVVILIYNIDGILTKVATVSLCRPMDDTDNVF